MLRRAKIMSKTSVSAALTIVCLTQQLAQSQSDSSSAQRSSARSNTSKLVTGPTRTMSEGLAAGATVVITVQPVNPKTVPASTYPPGSSIVDQTLILNSVPARVWLETHITGWDPGTLKIGQVTIDAIDLDGDGGGYDGDKATCVGLPMAGAGDLYAAIQSCDGGTCQVNPNVHCISDAECTQGGQDRCNTGYCQGNPAIGCRLLSHCTSAGAGGPCVRTIDEPCRGTMSGVSTPCPLGEPSKCIQRPAFYPLGGYVCEYGFFNRCDPADVLTGVSGLSVFVTSEDNPRFGFAIDPGEVVTDFAPTHLATFVLDVPASAKGAYRLDYRMSETFLQNFGPPGENEMPIGLLQKATIQVKCGSCCTNLGPGTSVCTEGVSFAECNDLPTTNTHVFRPGATCELCCTSCISNSDCNDGDLCTVDFCDHEVCYCTNPPKPSWEPATECCHPWTGVVTSIPQSSPCKIGGCSMGGSHGDPTLTVLPNGSACISNDPCYGNGICQAGICQNEEYAGSGCPKVRFISFAPGTGSTMSAYRVRLVSLHHPNPPYTGAPTADFSSHEGEVRWLGPPNTYDESTSDPTPVYTSFVQCQPHYGDWSGVDLLHVTGGEILPSSVYEVQSIAQGLDINVESNYSAPMTLRTARWGDIVIPNSPPGTTVQPDAGDIAELVDKFKNTSQPCSKPRALLSSMDINGIPNLVLDVSFADIAACVGANKGEGYPYAWPGSCP